MFSYFKKKEINQGLSPSFLLPTISLQLIEQINQSKVDPLIQSLSALVLGLTLQFNDDSLPNLGRANIQDIIVRRIKTDLFITKMDYLKDAEFLKSSRDVSQALKSLDQQGLPKLFLDPDFVLAFKDMIGTSKAFSVFLSFFFNGEPSFLLLFQSQ